MRHARRTNLLLGSEPKLGPPDLGHQLSLPAQFQGVFKHFRKGECQDISQTNICTQSEQQICAANLTGRSQGS